MNPQLLLEALQAGLWSFTLVGLLTIYVWLGFKVANLIARRYGDATASAFFAVSVLALITMSAVLGAGGVSAGCP